MNRRSFFAAIAAAFTVRKIPAAPTALTVTTHSLKAGAIISISHTYRTKPGRSLRFQPGCMVMERDGWRRIPITKAYSWTQAHKAS